MLTDFCSFLEELYGGTHYFTKHPMGYDILVIENGYDKFKINLTDKDRFGKFTLFHRNFGAFLDGTYAYHKQVEGRDLSYILFCAYQHDFAKKNGISWNKENYQRLMQDWRRYCNEQIIQENSGGIVDLL